MALNESKGNMYEFVTHTWNTIKGKCPHDCSYCYMKRWGAQKPIRFDVSELETDLGTGNFIFVGSSNDMFAYKVEEHWVKQALNHCKKFENQYLFQTKNPAGVKNFELPDESIICTTIETNRFYKDIMRESPHPFNRAMDLSELNYPHFVTIEPIMDFDIIDLIDIIILSNPIQVNIGADSGDNKLPEPSKDKIKVLINELRNITKVVLKSNLKRLTA